ncbi:MAG: metalloregulator ArsR/SmtB family transcription factor [Coriobacteriaceae bacterium]|nr:metalloregulator ArsR/SmtB family transcription factor [Coriobacteriaceae bacterium]
MTKVSGLEPKVQEGCKYNHDCDCDHAEEDFARIQNALEAIPQEDLIVTATEIFSSLADSTRFRILSALSAGELCVSDLLCATSVSQSAVSHQLRFLRDKKLVRVQREGQRALYSLADDHVKNLIDLALEHAME